MVHCPALRMSCASCSRRRDGCSWDGEVAVFRRRRKGAGRAGNLSLAREIGLASCVGPSPPRQAVSKEPSRQPSNVDINATPYLRARRLRSMTAGDWGSLERTGAFADLLPCFRLSSRLPASKQTSDVAHCLVPFRPPRRCPSGRPGIGLGATVEAKGHAGARLGLDRNLLRAA